jgi:hypothetical protein
MCVRVNRYIVRGLASESKYLGAGAKTAYPGGPGGPPGRFLLDDANGLQDPVDDDHYDAKAEDEDEDRNIVNGRIGGGV